MSIMAQVAVLLLNAHIEHQISEGTMKKLFVLAGALETAFQINTADDQYSPIAVQLADRESTVKTARFMTRLS